MSELTDWILAIFTMVLAGATIFLGWNTSVLAKVTKEASLQTERRKIMPVLNFDAVQPLSDSGGLYVRFAVKNIGKGHAKINDVIAKLLTGEACDAQPVSPGDLIEVNNLFYWNLHGAKIGDQIELSIYFSDIEDTAYPAYKHKFPIH